MNIKMQTAGRIMKRLLILVLVLGFCCSFEMTELFAAEAAETEQTEYTEPEEAEPAQPAAEEPAEAEPAQPAAEEPEEAEPAQPAAEEPEEAEPAQPAAEEPEEAEPVQPAAEEPEEAEPVQPAAEEPEEAEPAQPAAEEPEEAEPVQPAAEEPEETEQESCEIILMDTEDAGYAEPEEQNGLSADVSDLQKTEENTACSSGADPAGNAAGTKAAVKTGQEATESEAAGAATAGQDNTAFAHPGLSKESDRSVSAATESSSDLISADFAGTQISAPADGFNYIDNQWGWYLNGELQDSLSGIIKGVINGKTAWYYIENGIYKTSTGITQCADGSDPAWYYVENGKYKKKTGIAPYADRRNRSWYYVENGRYKKTTGITQCADGSDPVWYYVENGKYKKKTGIAPYADRRNRSWYYVENGRYKRTTGITQCADGSDPVWYYVENGKYKKKTGIAPYADRRNRAWYYVENGAYKRTTCLALCADGSDPALYYVLNGKYQRANGWKYIWGNYYYFKEANVLAKDEVVTVNGKSYTFNYLGEYVENPVISPLATSQHLTNKYYDRYGNDITRITLHHMASHSLGEDCALYFCTNGLENSANYCIGYDGDISCNVVENYGSWTSSNNYNDRRAICIELSDDAAGSESMTDATIESLICLSVDLIRRYPTLGGRFNYLADGTGNITFHRMFADTTCPGDWLISRLPWIQKEVNRRLKAEK